MSRKPLTLTLSHTISVEEFLVAHSDKLTTLEFIRLKSSMWCGKRIVITIQEEPPSEQDYLGLVISRGYLLPTPNEPNPYQWDFRKVTHEWVSVFVSTVCERMCISQPWRWAKERFGLSNLKQSYNNLLKAKRASKLEQDVSELLKNVGVTEA